MRKPTQQQIMDSYLLDMQRELANGEKIKQQTEALRTENWSLEKRNTELKETIVKISEREKIVKESEARYKIEVEKLKAAQLLFKSDQGVLYRGQVELTTDKKEFEILKIDLDKRGKNLADKEKATEAREFEVEIDKGKLEQRLKAYRDKLEIT